MTLLNILSIALIFILFILFILLIIIVNKYKNKINILNDTVLNKENELKKTIILNNLKLEEKETDIKNINAKLNKYKDKLSEREIIFNKVKTDLEETINKYKKSINKIIRSYKMLKEEKEKKDKIINKHKKVIDILSDRPEKTESTEAFQKIRIIYDNLISKCMEYDLPSAKLSVKSSELFRKIEDAVNFPLFYHKNIIAICGQFSSGKTSMINSLLKENILPTSIEPTTAINTFVINDEKEGLYIRNCFSGQTKVDKELYEFVTHSFTKEYSADVRNMVKYVSLHTEKLRYENIALLDTPGYTGQGQSAEEDDSNMAMKGIVQSDNIIWVVDIDNGNIKNNDLEFLTKEELEGKDILIVFNKADIKTEDDINNIIEQSRIQLDNNGIDYKDIIAYSSHYPEDYEKERKKLIKFFESENKSIKRNYFGDLHNIFEEFIDYYKDMDEDLSIYTEALNVVKIKSAFDTKIGANKSIDSSLKKVKDNRNKIREFIKDLEKAKEECLDLLEDCLYSKDREKYNKHKKELYRKQAKVEKDTIGEKTDGVLETTSEEIRKPEEVYDGFNLVNIGFGNKFGRDEKNCLSSQEAAAIVKRFWEQKRN